MHQSRPRSRNPVELQTEINNSNITSSIPLTKLSAKTTSHQLGSPRPYPQPSVFHSKPDLKGIPFETMATVRPYKDSRCMDWMLKGQNVSIPNKDLREMMQAKGNSSTNTTFPQHYQENNNLGSCTDFSSSFGELESQSQSDPCCLFLNPELESYSPNERQMSRQFIDAWSITRDNPTGTTKSSFDDSGKLSPSTLSLSMSGDNGVGEDTDQIQMGLGIIDYEFDNSGGSKSQPLCWMTPVS
ncbi:hypothetical protein IFM89_034703 [Coptis chinensis]|uniref:Uncharacterized protein n=1 Tax=Coptis chinensis TaxID=261450 RepID=A0A835H976_9MAGN|nr:hypothetical protein IFM89_034703 [Coptis chinensis]